MKYHEFPNTDLRVSQLCFGCWGIISDAHWGDRTESDSISAMHAAIDGGVNFFDTAPMYGGGASEQLLGQFLSDNQLRSKTIVATKIRPDQMHPDNVITECNESLQRLQTDYIDLYQTHWTSRDVPLEETWGAMLRLQEQGKVRHVGLCNAGVGDLASVLATSTQPLTNQLPYNLLWRAIESDIVPACEQNRIGILVYSPLMHGILADKYASADEVPDGRARTRHFSSSRAQTRHNEPGCEAETFAALSQIRDIAARLDRSMADLALAWILQQPGIVSVIAGASNSAQMNANLSHAGEPLADDVVAELNQATEPLRTRLGNNPDMWDSGENARFQ